MKNTNAFALVYNLRGKVELNGNYVIYACDRNCIFGIGWQWIDLPCTATGPCGKSEYQFEFQLDQVFLYRSLSLVGSSQSETWDLRPTRVNYKLFVVLVFDVVLAIAGIIL